MIRLWLDDERSPEDGARSDGWTWVKSAEEAIALLQTGTVVEVSLDYNLGIGRPSGLDVATWMAEHNVWPRGGARSHSSSAAGRWEIRAVLERIRAAQPVLPATTDHPAVYRDGSRLTATPPAAPSLTDTMRLDTLRALCGYVEDGSNQTVRIYQDDATKDWFVCVGTRYWFARSFRAAVDAVNEAQCAAATKNSKDANE